jgi:hypothetical protein
LGVGGGPQPPNPHPHLVTFIKRNNLFTQNDCTPTTKIPKNNKIILH